jgi:hypothetical protein
MIYRLGQEGGKSPERTFLPMTLMFVFSMQKNSSAPFCDPWNVAAKREVLENISSGRKIFDRVEVNLLLSHWSFSGVEPLSEQSRYLLRVFKLMGSPRRLVPALLENTPDTKKIKSDSVLLAQFEDWAYSEKVTAEADNGFLNLPDKFSAEKAISISPYASSQIGNAPFSDLLADKNRLSRKVIERLDSLSCQGCHQIRSIAGFHFPGVENTQGQIGEKFAVSAHFESIQSWRQIERQSDVFIKLPDLYRLTQGSMGDSCQESGDKPQLCGTGFVCDTKHAGYSFSRRGQCIPSERRIGSVCDPAEVSAKEGDIGAYYKEIPLESCRENGFCAFGKAGFPGGYCSEYCTHSSDKTDCFSVPLLGPFTECVERSGDHDHCARLHSVSARMQICTKQSDCRTDYSCVLAGRDSAICAPNYLIPGLTLKHK